MLYIIIGLLFIILAIVLSMKIKTCSRNSEENILEDIPSVNISKEELEKHASDIANYPVTKYTNCRRKLIKSLDISYKKIIQGYEYIDKTIKEKKEVTPASEWLLDNLYLIEKEYKHIKYNMPKSYYKNLPVIKKGIMKGYPRIYHIAVEIVSHINTKIDENIIEGFIKAYQDNTILTSGELWALPIMLRIALIQNISKITDGLVYYSKERIKADNISDRIISAIHQNNSEEKIKKIIKEEIKFSTQFTERLLKILRDNGVDNEEVNKWISDKLEIKETNSEAIVNSEHIKQASQQFAMGNSIDSIREIEALNWRELFEKISFVEKYLREDPLDIYSKMDFKSRDYYRHKIEKLSKSLSKSEIFIAKKAIECAKEATEVGEKDYKKHVGYYIVDKGVKRLKQRIYGSDKVPNSFKDNLKENSVACYIGTIIVCTLIVIGIFLGLSYINDGQRKLWRYIIATIALLVPCSEIVISILNWTITNTITPNFIPKIEFKEDIGEDNKTIVVIPTIINNVKRAKQLVENMEVYFLANSDKNIYFAILSDFKDSDKEKEEQDEKILNVSLKAVEELNKKYSKNGEDIFYFFSRYRQFNEKEGKWLGWERKRGKLIEFNHLIRGNKNTSYDVISSHITELSKAKYIITLDADTELPRDSAKKLIGAMSHILNEPHINKDKKRVIRGYGIMQPRIGINTLSSNKTMFSRIFSGESGIDTYTTAVSDVYQDIFGEGIFTGKGIYNIDVFNYMLENEIPENTVLSHDLLEGSYVRSGLVTDIELIDGYPAYFNSSSKRLHRWVRGDWQLVPWFKKKNSINTLSKWKMFDNLRRSLLAPSIIVLTALSFNILPDGTDKWIVASILALITPLIFDITESVASPIRGISLSGKINNKKVIIEQIFLILCFLPFNAYLMIDAILRTLYRLAISKKNLLEWQTAADAEKNAGKKLNDYIKLMWPGSLISIIMLLLAFKESQDAGMFMIPVTFLWFISPAIACYISAEKKHKFCEINEENKEMLRRISRETWAYFDDFVNNENNWLPPDNYQEEPYKGVAHRTSPTNIAMGLTSNLAAYDLGYIDMSESVDRIFKIINSMESLESYKGHLYNWYDTITKEPLRPKYISTVDSGNLVGYLWVVEQTLKEYLKCPYLNINVKKGIEDTLNLANEEVYEKLGINDFYIDDINNIKSCKFNAEVWIKFLKNITNKFIIIEGSKNESELYWNSKLKQDIRRYLYHIEIIYQVSEEIDTDILNIFTEVPLKNLSEALDNISEKKKIANLTINKLVEDAKANINKLINKIKILIDKCNNMVENTDFKMLYDYKRGLFAIGYDVEKDTLGKCYYDLLASEARQASFVAIAKGDIDTRHWFRLGRSMALIGVNKGLVSWSGTMFEYLMPLLVMKPYPNTILSETYRSIVTGQKKYGKLNNIPWGISESAYRAFDVSMNYQYKAFGIPGIGLKRGLKDELVISPYSTVMALQVDLNSSINNIVRLIKDGVEGRYGLYEAVDYTKDRLPKDVRSAIVKCFMVHHEGMSLMALDNVLNNNIFRERFHSSPKVKSAEVLLQEKVPNRIIYEREQKFQPTENKQDNPNIISRRFITSKTTIPKIQLMSNGNYSMMITNSGSGYGKREDMTIYRWKKDVTLDASGMFFYVKDIKNDYYWSTTYEPCKKENDSYEVIFSQYKAEFKNKEEDILAYTEITVSNEDDAEIRRITLTNNGNEPKVLEITSYCEVTLAPFDADIVHPAFSNLFIRTEFLQELECVIANRRPRAKGQRKPHAMQCITIDGEALGVAQYETSRVNFIGRDRNLVNPIAMEHDMQLKNSEGAVLDPIISIRKRIKIEPGKSCRIAFTTAVTDSREDCVELAKKYREFTNVDRAFDLAYNQNIVDMRYLGLKSPQANLYEEIASKILFISDSYKKREEYIKNVSRGQQSLWKYGISGDIPILLVIIREESHIDLVRQALNAYEYITRNGLKVDLVILNLQDTTYTQPLQDAIRNLILSSSARDKENVSGGVFLNNKSTFEEEDINLLMAISSIVLDGEKGLLSKQIDEEVIDANQQQDINIEKKEYSYEPYDFKVGELEYYNDIGGFDLENDEYVIILNEGKTTPAPWINVIANENFGFIVSESGSPYTWYKNSRENKITTWSNDWVSDPPSEVIYLRDEENGDIWSITPEPIRDNSKYVIRHGFGYSKFEHQAFGIAGEVTMFVPMNENVKICRIKLNNTSNIDRKLSLTYYAQLVLGVVPQKTNRHIATYLNENKKYIYGRNPYSDVFGSLNAYLKIIGGNDESFTGNRTDFIGRGESLEDPLALKKVKLSNNVGAGMDPCLAESVKVSINKGEEKTLLVILGEDESIEDIENIIDKYENIDNAENELQNSKSYWQKLLHTIKVNTPDETMDLMLNGWLLYQTISCRIWARSAFYQSGGAFGFRDQLQDVMAAGYVDSNFMREHILYSATRQFTEGDVQHWWHPVVDSGIRTRFSDDLLWLPYVTVDYIKRTGDYSILDEEVGYLEDRPLEKGEDERYTISQKSDKIGTIYEHCINAIERGLHFGPHNIPLMGSGDWNDGMSEVGNKGTGESVWLGWFLYSILDGFKEISEVKNDKDRVKRYKEIQQYLKENLNKNAWDGNWYRRAYFDDGTPLGSVENDECKIDSLAQSWAVISGAGDKEKIKTAMESLEKYLVKQDTGMVLLLTPPFESSKLEPGYIKGYVPGVRENGGQYTHASTWVVLAMAMLGEGDKAWRIFNMLNPINHTKSYFECERYKVEPYVITADIYGREPYVGRGGWSWYTGAAGWMYRVAIEGILGLKFKGNRGFVIEPNIPNDWNGFEIEYNRDKCKYIIKVISGEEAKVLVDGNEQKENIIPLLKDGVHNVEVVIKRK
ncbi:NdvB [Clostridium botulinum]|uniref:NdvB n=2 Tax=Clostridium botulinum TaxID=1491 RepID=A0A0A0I955_CLOBO|nr:glucoamylase family protein [Clostridium botulinum]KGM97083.1 NdvB [Clostridium botulinum C/D str. DC5]KOC53506.1 NdvB [Clostridium botulinum]KOC57880.1 NdvB [Clostridium botulinum]MCD3234245.1 cyclic beta 1-2 glucan synthetase [Clostridium botulinum D/C]MCD3240142.1 cyclic beta 1-2 glucan synthetase [Clostridium botulinum D/C]